MKLPKLSSLSRNQKIALGGGAAGGAVLLGIRARKAGGGASALGGVSRGGSTLIGAPGANAGGGPGYVPAGSYDSTAVDLYNSIQPQIEALTGQVGQLALAQANPLTVLNPAQPAGEVDQPSSRTPNPAPATTAWNDAYSRNLQAVFDLAGRIGVPVGFAGESEQARSARIAREVTNSQRDWASVERGFRFQASKTAPKTQPPVPAPARQGAPPPTPPNPYTVAGSGGGVFYFDPP